MRAPRAIRTAAVLVVPLAALLLPAAAAALTREPVAVYRAELRGEAPPTPPAHRGRAEARQARLRPVGGPAVPLRGLSTSAYGPPELEAVQATLQRLAHGPELASLSVYVATPAEIATTCGATVIACYAPGEEKMIVSGLDGGLGGVPRAFAIAHEYGHHIANSQLGGPISPAQAGTVRWATYERVCQLTRAKRLFPGNQAGRYWENPEEAFAETYAQLADPSDRVPWQFTELLRPSDASLAKLEADLRHPWAGPVTQRWQAELSSPAGGPGGPSAVRTIKTPLDGPVEASISAATGAPFTAVLRDRETGRVLAHVGSDPEGQARLDFTNCGHDALRLTLHGAAGAELSASITRP
jgi:hypothetical protein